MSVGSSLPSASNGRELCASSKTRWPFAAALSSFSCSDANRSPIINSPAPITNVPWSAKLTPLHLRAEENGTVDRLSQPGLSGYFSRMACAVGFWSCRVNVTAATAAPICSGVSVLISGSISSTCMVPSVMVPVLSRQIVSTRASISIEYSSCTRALWNERRTTLLASTILVSSTSPSGTMPTRAATVLTIACA